MSSISELQSDIDKYNRLKERLQAVSRCLAQAADSCRSFSTRMNENVSINGNETQIAAKARDMGGYVDSIRNYIDRYIIPHIDWNNKCSRESIEQLEQDEG